ncbi:MAG: hypothetical protein MI739_07940 [Bacteroidales bacterium]|nr:hypothetical protein [Bacteroidales bacterium]
MKKFLISGVATVVLILSTTIYSNAKCDGLHIHACESQLDKIQDDVNKNCQVGETVYVHVVEGC